MADIERTHSAKDVAGFTWLFELKRHLRSPASGSAWMGFGRSRPEHRASTPGVGRPTAYGDPQSECLDLRGSSDGDGLAGEVAGRTPAPHRAPTGTGSSGNSWSGSCRTV